ncbi:MAG: hypothetical protein COB07_03825 [Sulfurovum sp.]|nr:MAG: hypothetical protein COB07_03825 [Sulfurovum sp.]
MKHILLVTLISMGLSIGLIAQTEHNRKAVQSMSTHKIKQMDRKHKKHKAQRRDFRTQKEFQHKTKRKHSGHITKYSKYNNENNYNRPTYRDDYRMNRQRGFRRGNRGWSLAYRYDRVSFYDNEGYYYGYFNHYGYYFEDIFYRYDRYYTYNDRVEGRGLFDHRYYMPENYRNYGFCRPGHNSHAHKR